MVAPTRTGSAKRDAIIRAATLLFHRYGYRKTTVDLIAHEAEVAKPTLYAHFADKDAVFVAVCQHVMDEILADAATAREQADVLDRLTRVLCAKFTKLFELVHFSPHASELLASQAAAAKQIVITSDAAYLKLLTDTIRAASRRGELSLERFGRSPATLAQLLMQAGHGAAYGADSATTHREHVRALVAALVGPAIVR